jgi:hypothetical protein
MFHKKLPAVLMLSFLTGCTGVAPVGLSPRTNTSQNENDILSRKVKEIIQPQIGGTITVSDNTVVFELTLPRNNFKTKALDMSSFKFFRITLTDSTGRVYYPTNIIHDADPAKDNLVAVSPDGKIKAVFKNVKFDHAIIGKLVAFDENKEEIHGSELSAAFSYNAANLSVEITYRTTPTGGIIEKLLDIDTTQSLNVAKKVLAGNALQKFIDELTGVTGTNPNYTYTTHPSLIDIDKIVEELLANGGDVKELNPDDPAFHIEPTTVTGNINGLVSTDKVTVRVNDNLSLAQPGLGTGEFNIDVFPDAWETFITVDTGAGTTYTVNSPISTDATVDVNLGDITLTPATPAITSVLPVNGKKDDPIVISGNNFHANIDGNVVKFGTATAEVTASTNNQLTVKVPDGIYGTVKITDSVGTQTSNEADFAVTPHITSNDTSAKIGGDLTINGTGFDFDTKTNNIVTIGGLSATVSSATNNQIKATVPAGLYGEVTVKVAVGNEESNESTFNITPYIESLNQTDFHVNDTVEINGTGFDFDTKANNIVKFGSTAQGVVTVVSATATKITVQAPFVANDNVTVTVDEFNSNGSAFFILPEISMTAPTSGNTYNGTVALSATVTSPNTITKVEFYEGGSTLLGEDTTGTSGVYDFNWDTLSPTFLTGSKSLTAKVTDADSRTATSTPAKTITLDQIPVISDLTASETPSGLGYPIELTASATDDGTITYDFSELTSGAGTFSASTAANKKIWKAPSSAGTYTIQVSVDDGVNDPVTKTLDITLTDSKSTVTISGGSN